MCHRTNGCKVPKPMQPPNPNARANSALAEEAGHSRRESLRHHIGMNHDPAFGTLAVAVDAAT